LDSVIFNEVLDRKVAGMEELFRSTLEQSLATFLERNVPVSMIGPSEFDFKELKASLPGEVVLVSSTATDGGPGRILFVLSKEGAGVLGDMLLMGDGTAAFSHEEHLEPVRDLFKEVSGSFCGILSKEIKRHVSFDEIKVALVDLTPSDFVGTGWIIAQYDLGLQPSQSLFRLTSQDFCQVCFPDTESADEAPESAAVDETVEHEAQKEMGMVLDIELPISIELGRTTMLIRDIVKLAPGSIVELDKLSGEPVDLFVNGRLFGKGEVVVVDENFAVRLTGLVSPNENARTRRN